MHNVAPTRALARRSRHVLTIGFVVSALGVFVAMVGVAMSVIKLAAPSSPSYGFYTFASVVVLVGGVIVFFIGVGLAVRAVTYKTDNDLAMITGKFLGRYLDERYHFIRNISRKGLGYIDAVLIGPPGALVFRILDKRGTFANEAADWLKQNNGRWVTAGINPTREAVEDIKHLREYLAQNRLGDVPVYGVVVFTREEPHVYLSAKEPVVPVSTLGSLVANLGSNYLAKERIDPAKVGAIVRILYET
jgi:hypothetical protein